LKQQQQKTEEKGGNASSTREEKDEYFGLDLNRFQKYERPTSCIYVLRAK
jgi:hypothetical protein